MMMLKPDLFDFAFVPDWYGQLNELREMALPEPWRFKKPMNETKNQDTPILERYLHIIFRKQCIEFNFHSTRDIKKSSQFFHVENERACFHTGLYNSRYKGIYAFFERNHKKDSMLDWYFRGFCDELSPWLRYIQPLPQKPSFYVTQKCAGFNPDWPVRANVEHILGDAEIWSGFQRRSARRRTCRYYLKQRWNWAEEGLWWNRGLWYLKDTREKYSTCFRSI